MVFDIHLAREQTPGCHNIIHFNNAGASLMPRPVLDAVVAHLQQEARLGSYEAALEAHAAINRMYGAAAILLNCQPDEIAFMESATRAWNMVFHAIPLRCGDRILTSMSEYASNYTAFLQLARRVDVRVEVIPNDEHGQISLEALWNAIDSRVKLISLTHVPTNNGLVNPAIEVGKIARECGALFLLDACQSVGQIPIDVQAIGCDMLSAAGRKYLRGPRGTGFVYVRQGILEQLEPALLDVQAAPWTAINHFEFRRDARRFENWETNLAAKIGLGVAIEYALGWGLEAIWKRVALLAGLLRAQLAQVADVTLHDTGVERCGIVSFTVRDRLPSEIHHTLRQQGINVWTSELSLTRLDMEARGLTELIRASVHYFNTEEEIAQFCAALEAVIGVMRMC